MPPNMGTLSFSKVSPIVFILISAFSISSWADIVGLWMELPLMIKELPEGWSLPSYMSLVTQLANVVPLLYFIVSRIYSRRRSAGNDVHNKTDILLSFAIISVELMSMFFMSLFWDYTIIIGGQNRSVALLALLCCSGVCSCLSSLVFLPYMARYPDYYISAYYLGNGLCGIVPGLIALSQGIGEEPLCVNITSLTNETCSSLNCEDSHQFQMVPRYPPPNFSVQVYLIFICCLLAISLLSFYFLNYTRLVKHQLSKNDRNQKRANFVVTNDMKQQKSNEVTGDELLAMEKQAEQSLCNFIYQLVLTGIINAVYFGAVPSLLPFSCLPYGDSTYNLALRLSFMAGAVASVAVLFLPEPGGKVVTAIVSVGLLSSGYHLILALQSPHPVFQYEVAGPFLAIAGALVMSICFSYTRVTIAAKLHSWKGRQALMWCGVLTQIGTFFGTMITFALINWTTLFVRKPPCSG